jgi:hypothetical protein
MLAYFRVAFHWRLCGTLALFILIAQAPALWALFNGIAPFGKDALSQFLPWRDFSRQALQSGVWPLWNPHVFCGMPFFSNGQSALLYLPNIIYLIFPTQTALWIDAFGHQLWLALGGYFLGRTLRLSRSASLLVALCLALGATVPARLYAGHMTWHAARAWIPWLLGCTLWFLRSDQAIQRRAALSIVLCAVALLHAGHPLTALLGLALTTALVAVYLLTHRAQWKRLPWSLALAILVLCVALGAASLLPFVETSGLGLRRFGMTYQSAITGSGSWRSLVRLLLPDFFGGDSVWQWSTRHLSFEESASIGLIPALLALGAPLLARRRISQTSNQTSVLPRAVWWLWVAMCLSLVLALGNKTFLYRLAYEGVPFFKSLHIPVRWLSLWHILAALLAGFAFEGCRRRLNEPRALSNPGTILRYVLGAFSIGLGLLALVIFVFPAEIPFWREFAQWNARRTATEAAQAAQILRQAALFSCLSSAVISGFGALLLAKSLKQRQLSQILLGLMALQLVVISWQSALPVTPRMQAAANWPADLVTQYQTGQRWDTDFTEEWNTYSWSVGVPHKIDLFSGYDPSGPYRFFVFANQMERRSSFAYPYQPTRRTVLLRVAGVTHTLQAPTIKPPQTSFGPPRLNFQSDSWALWQHQGAWPRVYLSANVIERPEKSQDSENQLQALEKLAGGDFYKQKQPVVVAPGDFEIQHQDEPGHIINWRRDLNRFEVDLSTRQPAILVIGDTFYPGWRAYEKSGNQLKVRPANYLFRGVQVPKGAQRVTLVYEPQTVRFAFFVSLCGLAGLAFLSLMTVKELIKKRL